LSDVLPRWNLYTVYTLVVYNLGTAARQETEFEIPVGPTFQDFPSKQICKIDYHVTFFGNFFVTFPEKGLVVVLPATMPIDEHVSFSLFSSITWLTSSAY